MIASLKRYFRLFFITFFLKKEKLILINHFVSFYFTKSFLRTRFAAAEKRKALELAVEWLLSSQKKMKDGGFGTFYVVDSWTSSYPETSGYILPTLYDAIAFMPDKKPIIEASILSCADWLLDIQKPSGGWQSYYVEHNRPEVVFNTGQVLRGLLVAYQITQDPKYLTSLKKACDWLVQVQENDGSWIKMASMQQPRVYDSYVSHPLLMVYELCKNENYKNAAVKNLNWILTQQQSNGWFANADNTQKHNDRPILHTISYTIDGLINGGLLLKDKKYIDAGKLAADKLLLLFEQNRYLNGRFDHTWDGSEHMICTGCAQISVIWSNLYQYTQEEKYLVGMERMNDQLVYIQRSCLTLQGIGNGAVSGSFPIWGKYEAFGFPNWASKYFADAIMNELKINSKFG